MGTCSDNKIKFMRECWGLDDDGEEREWANFPANFEILPQAMVTMFTLATQDNWPALMFAGIDSVGRVAQPPGSKYSGAYEVESSKQNNAPVVFIFYFASILLGGYLVLNMFVR